MKTMNKPRRKKPSNCHQTSPEGNPCLGKYVLTYEANAPIFTCTVCGDTDTTWQKFYNEYLQLYKVKANWDEKKNQVSCIIGFFCFCYQEHYSTNYTFVPQNPNPYGSKECRDAWAMLAAFNGNAHDARKYIYWVFHKAINKTTAITSLGYLNAPGLIRKYKLYAQRKDILNRASRLPQEFLDWWAVNASSIQANYAMVTMNDLGALLSYVNHYTDIPAESEERLAIKKAEQLNLIVSGKLNVGG
jgi:hypothetical protein